MDKHIDAAWTVAVFHPPVPVFYQTLTFSSDSASILSSDIYLF